MAIPTLTKEEIFSSQEINTIKNTRAISDSELDDLVTSWNTRAVGYVKLIVMESYSDYIPSASWEECIQLYCQWKSSNVNWSTDQQELSNGFYVQLEQTLSHLKENVTQQAQLNVIPNKQTNFKTFN